MVQQAPESLDIIFVESPDRAKGGFECRIPKSDAGSIDQLHVTLSFYVPERRFIQMVY